MKKQLHSIILASSSPRRKDLLTQIGLEFQVVPSDYEEDMTMPLPPLELTVHLAKGKALAVTEQYPNAIIIGADTIVALGDTILGKPHSEEEAERMLQSLSGTQHNVITGMAVIIPASLSPTKTQIIETHISSSTVTLHKLPHQEILNYIATKEPLDKAGAYAIQGYASAFVQKIEGSYSGIVGLPVDSLYVILNKYNIWPGLS
jgi:septum formation protein